MMRTLTFATVMTCSFLLTLFIPAMAQQQDREQQKRRQMPEECRMMMQRCQQCRQMMGKMNTELSEKLDKMQKAEGDAKINAMADVISTLVEQRKTMFQKMEEMQDTKMQYMQKYKEGKCPMMPTDQSDDQNKDQ